MWRCHRHICSRNVLLRIKFCSGQRRFIDYLTFDLYTRRGRRLSGCFGLVKYSNSVSSRSFCCVLRTRMLSLTMRVAKDSEDTKMTKAPGTDALSSTPSFLWIVTHIVLFHFRFGCSLHIIWGFDSVHLLYNLYRYFYTFICVEKQHYRQLPL